MLESLHDLLELKGNMLLVLGGSSVTQLSSPTSDTDIFAIADSAYLSQVKRLIALLKRADLEVRDMEWLGLISEKLSDYEPPINGGPSPFNFWDLRFLARVSLGKVLLPHDEISSQIASLSRQLQIALASYISSGFIAMYEDAIGLLLAERFEEVLPIAGELSQRACLLALLQTKLIDPSPKWAISLARNSTHRQMRSRADQLFTHLGSYFQYSPRDWVVRLLNLANSIIAIGISETFTKLADTPKLEGMHITSIDEQTKEPACCIMGVPGYLTIVNVKINKIFLCNQAFIAKISECC